MSNNRSYFGEDFIAIPRERFIKEHNTLLKVLEKGDPKQLKSEAKDQKKELKGVLKKSKKTSSNTYRE
jgi:hypothetical protein